MELLLIIISAIFHIIKADQSLQCGDWEAFKDELCFKVFDNKELHNFSDAKNTCNKYEGSGLLSIRSKEEQNFVFNLLHDVHKTVNDVWIGAEYKENELKWTSNVAVNYTNWANGYPVNESGYDCVNMIIGEPFHGKWVNAVCNKNNVVVCEKPQNWLFSYLQTTVMELRISLENTIKRLEKTETDLKNTITKLEQTNSNLQSEIIKSATETTPPGTVAYYTNTTAPLGWLKANGQSVSRTTYANLFATLGTSFGSGDGSTTFTLPDLRGEFIRGWSDGRDVDTNRVFASFQWGSTIPFPLYIDGTYGVATASGMHTNRYFSGSTFDGGFVSDISTGATRDGITFGTASDKIDYAVTTAYSHPTSWTALIGTRPRNIALLACIKY